MVIHNLEGLIFRHSWLKLMIILLEYESVGLVLLRNDRIVYMIIDGICRIRIQHNHLAFLFESDVHRHRDHCNADPFGRHQDFFAIRPVNRFDHRDILIAGAPGNTAIGIIALGFHRQLYRCLRAVPRRKQIDPLIRLNHQV